APAAFDEATVKALEERVIRAAPAAGAPVEVVSRETNPVILGQNQSYGFVIGYSALGKVFRRSVVFVNTPDTQLVFHLSAPKAEFDGLNQSFRRSIGTWQRVDPPGATVTAANTPQSAMGAAN
ncbi:MAG: hypothetical protein M3Z64_06640, partial [Verrucomicrobiota bacterium]|nr:hypothetical protein [Verrucomicrobiota bacterium]